jgi:hypothetical protein
MTAINVETPLRDLCARLGLEYTNVARLDITPGRTVATVYKERNGKKYCLDGTSEAAVEVIEVETRS